MINSAIAIIGDRPCESVHDLTHALECVEHRFVASGDRRGIFAAAYLVITRELAIRVREGRFHDGAWISTYAANFGNLYLSALHGYETGRRNLIPAPWRIAFDAARSPSVSGIQLLMLGINAHINFDLALALLNTGIDPDRDSRASDHAAVNEALRATTPAAQRRMDRLHSPGMRHLSEISAPFDKTVCGYGFVAGRHVAWNMGCRLVDARSGAERARLISQINRRATAFAKAVLLPTTAFGPVQTSVKCLRGNVGKFLPCRRRRAAHAGSGETTLAAHQCWGDHG